MDKGIQISKECAVVDGGIRVIIEKVWANLEPQVNYNKASMGMAGIVDGKATLVIPANVKAGQDLSAENVAEMVQEVVKMVLPGARVFYEEAKDEYGTGDF